MPRQQENALLGNTQDSRCVALQARAFEAATVRNQAVLPNDYALPLALTLVRHVRMFPNREHSRRGCQTLGRKSWHSANNEVMLRRLSRWDMSVTGLFQSELNTREIIRQAG